MVEVRVGSATIIREVWAYSAEDAVYQQVLRSKNENGVFQIVAVNPPEDRKDTNGTAVWSIKGMLNRFRR